MALLNLEENIKEFDLLLKKADLLYSGQNSDMLALNDLATKNFNTSVQFEEQDFPPPPPEVVIEADKLLLDIYSLVQNDPNLIGLRSGVDIVYQKLKQSLKNENTLIKDTQNKFTELSICMNKVQTAWRFNEENQIEFNNVKAEIQHSIDSHRALLEKEVEAKTKSDDLKSKIGIMDTTYQEELERIQKQVQRQLEQHQTMKKDTENKNAELLQKIKALEEEYVVIEAEIKSETNQIDETRAKYENFRNEFDIKESQIRILDDSLATVNREIINAAETTKEQEKKVEEIKCLIAKGEDNLKELTRAIKNQTAEKEAFKEKQINQQHELGLIEKEMNHYKTLKENFEAQVNGLTNEIVEAEKKHDFIRKLLRKEQKAKFAFLSEIKKAKDFLLTLEGEKEQMDIKVQHAKENFKILEDQYDLEQNHRTENQVDKDNMQLAVKKQQEKIHQVKDLLYALEREVKTLENKVAGSKNIVRKLNDQAESLKEQQEKYSQETSNAHAKFYQIIEDIKVKNYIIADLQENNKNLSKKLKQQKSLYEAVRNDRNVYQKSLLDMKANMETVTKEYQTLSHQVNQIKEDIKFKETEIITTNTIHANICNENVNSKQKKSILKTKLKIQEEQIKAHEEELIKLKGLISEANIEKKRKLNIHESIINERDMLSMQFFKKNSELYKLAEKNKSLKTFLEIDEKHFIKINKDMSQNFDILSILIKRNEELKEVYKAYFPIKQEIILIQKELLYTQSKNAAFENKLKQPLNIHPWKKMETTDPEKFDKIMQVNYLQKVLIERSHELLAIEEQIKGKEMELSEVKIIAERAAGKEDALTVEEFTQRIKDKTYSQNQMTMELKEEQAKIVRLTLEIDIIKTKINDYETEYFKDRRAEVKQTEQ